jgi:hypothetical protein
MFRFAFFVSYFECEIAYFRAEIGSFSGFGKTKTNGELDVKKAACKKCLLVHKN